ncbi:MAG: ATP-binding cassette domain-containing protein [Clostridia bacterium]|nr:ATP-binding cassette domain-containing protein [Clostridia bacterium]
MKINGLSFSYGEKVIFNDFYLDAPNGKVTCIMGSSGGGKTTLLNCISGQLDFEGQILYGQNGQNDIKQKSISYVFQQPRLIPSMTVEKNVEYVLPSSMSKEQRLMRVKEFIEKMKLSDCAGSYPRYISGGQASRASLARALVFESDILLMDEPFKGLDIKLKKQILEILTPLIKGKTVVFVTHDIEEALLMADSVYVLDRVDGEGVKIVGREDVSQPREDRDIYSDQLNTTRQNIYRLLTEVKK